LKPLEGIRVLDLSRMIAGGVAGMLLGDFGADVVKVEQPGVGDPLRHWTSGGEPFWWKVYARNKRYITLNLKSEDGRGLLRRLVPRFDVVMESFVPGTLERLGLSWEQLHDWNSRLILVRISGWGQTGPAAARPGFGSLVEAASGFVGMNGEPDGAPILPSFPLADMTSALYATNAVMFALYHRDAHGGSGQVVDVALFDSLFSLLGPLAAEYEALGKLRERHGSRSKNSGPRGCYETSDGRWIAVSGSTPKMAERFLQSYGLGTLLDDPRFANNEARVENGEALDLAITEAIRSRTFAENLEIINTNALTAMAVQTIADIQEDPHWRARQLLVDVRNGAGTVRMHNVVPRLVGTPGEIRWAGGELGEHNREVYANELGLDGAEIERLEATGVI
jgi:crotonobetainyl-CoA:carnitine CoA-transferase CaiB-like acyl-CoA transferase